nr:hypothetical protein CFP56_24410 [Quercus suber]
MDLIMVRRSADPVAKNQVAWQERGGVLGCMDPGAVLGNPRTSGRRDVLCSSASYCHEPDTCFGTSSFDMRRRILVYHAIKRSERVTCSQLRAVTNNDQVISEGRHGNVAGSLRDQNATVHDVHFWSLDAWYRNPSQLLQQRPSYRTACPNHKSISKLGGTELLMATPGSRSLMLRATTVNFPAVKERVRRAGGQQLRRNKRRQRTPSLVCAGTMLLLPKAEDYSIRLSHLAHTSRLEIVRWSGQQEMHNGRCLSGTSPFWMCTSKHKGRVIVSQFLPNLTFHELAFLLPRKERTDAELCYQNSGSWASSHPAFRSQTSHHGLQKSPSVATNICMSGSSLSTNASVICRLCTLVARMKSDCSCTITWLRVENDRDGRRCYRAMADRSRLEIVHGFKPVVCSRFGQNTPYRESVIKIREASWWILAGGKWTAGGIAGRRRRRCGRPLPNLAD